jgi:hypothetical protein
MILAHYEWSPNQRWINPDGNGTSQVFWAAGPGIAVPYFQPASGLFTPPNAIPYLGAYRTATPQEYDTYTNRPFTLNLRVIDKPSMAEGTMQFTGLLNGYVRGWSASQLIFTFARPTQELRVGQDLYRVSLAGITEPGTFPLGPPPPLNGWIDVHIEASPAGDGGPPLGNTPEPSVAALVLTGVSSLLVGTWRWRRCKTAG